MGSGKFPTKAEGGSLLLPKPTRLLTEVQETGACAFQKGGSWKESDGQMDSRVDTMMVTMEVVFLKVVHVDIHGLSLWMDRYIRSRIRLHRRVHGSTGQDR